MSGIMSATCPRLYLRKMNAQNYSSSIRFRLAISPEEYLAYYQGSAQDVVACSEDNKTIRFPASAIRKFVTNDGIFGDFEITFDENNKLIAIQSVD
ncbi:MAG: hypothetical protein ACI9JM_001219 [Halioglobus sp.]|jgi:hypothetical protein